MIDELENRLKTADGGVFCKRMKYDPAPIPLSSETMGAETHIASAARFIALN